ncbi:MAG: hypothetical protein EOP10_06425 [Proteobacteria bacterium]|nr:MAG: hypothetical protein EOP10_06425 [Pseudomonadota bacterium]
MRGLIPIFLALTACQTHSVQYTTSESVAPIKPIITNDTTTFRELPLAASLTQLPWTSDSWVTIHGGAAFRWQLAKADEADDIDDLQPFIHYPIGASRDVTHLSPIEKLDLYQGNSDWQLTHKERVRTLDPTRADIPDWEGMMHAWSAASLQFQPVAPVTLQSKTGGSIPFESQDIYSLISLFVHEQSPKPIVLASICPDAELGAAAGPYAFENEKQNLRRRACPPIDPAKFHTVLANQIGKRNEGFIIDRDQAGEISNNPVVAYESRILEKPGEPPAPNSQKTLHIKTVVFLTASTPIIAMDEEDEAYPYESEAYEYELTLDQNGKIASGRWLTPVGSNSNQSRPDFMWKSSPVWLNGPIKAVYERARESLVEQKKPKQKQLRPLEDMPSTERQSLNSYFNSSNGTTQF